MMDINEAFDRVRKVSKNVVDVVVLNKDNHIIRSSSGQPLKQMNNMIKILDQCRASFKQNEELTFLKLRTKSYEYLVVPDKEYLLVAMLDAADESTA